MRNELKQQEEINKSTEKKYTKTSLAADAWKRLQRNKLAVVGMIILIIFIIMAIFAPVIAPYNPIKINWGDEALPPFWMKDNISVQENTTTESVTTEESNTQTSSEE